MSITANSTKIAGDTKGEAYDVLAERVHGLEVYFEARIAELEKLLLQKLDDTDLRYQQRFDAQRDALDAAFQSAKESVAAALTSADRAVSKAEGAAEKRFESVNEFRNTLADQATKLATRVEVEQGVSNILDKLDGASGISRRMEELARRLDAAIARGLGKDDEVKASTQSKQWLNGLIFVGALSITGWVGTLIYLLTKSQG